MKYQVLINKALLMEAAAYDTIPPKARYQPNDVVVIRDDGRFAKYHNKKTQAYAEQVGTTIGYQKGSQTVKYAVEFDDGSVHLVHSHFLIGPFKNKQIAETYVNNTKEVTPEDLNTRGKEIHTADQRDQQIESKLRDVLTQSPFNVKWVESPGDSAGKTMLCDEQRVKVTRYNDKNTRQLKKYTVTVPIVAVAYLFGSYISLKEITPRQFLNNLNQHKDVFIKEDAITSGTLPVDEFVETVFNCTTDAAGNKVVVGFADNMNGAFKHHRDFFKDWTIQGDFTLYTTKSDLTDSPKSVTNYFRVHHKSAPIKSLQGIPIDSLDYYVEGFTQNQIQDYIDRQKYKQEVGQHAVSSGDSMIDQAFDDILDNL